jgi:VWFA-related protein
MIFPVAITLVLALAPQDSQPAPVGTRLVNLNVIAVDGHGDPVTDLTADDFQIVDAGKPQKIVLFNHRDLAPDAPPPLDPNQFSNRAGIREPHATVILFDLLNERAGQRGQAWTQLLHYLEPLDKADDLYLYLLTVDGRLYPVRGVKDARTREGAGAWTRGIKPLMDAAMHEVTRARPPEIDVIARVQLTYAALDSLALELSRIPGRKNIVWASDGVPLNARQSIRGETVDFTQQLRQEGEVLARSGVAIYPVLQTMQAGAGSGGGGAARGGARAAPTGSGAPGAAGVADVGSPDLVRGGVVGAGDEGLQTLDDFAGMTGGRPSQGKDIGVAIKEARNDLRVSYQIGYFPPAQDWDGKFHKLAVTCKRRGVRIQARTGYYASAENPEIEIRHIIDSAITMDFDAAEIALRASVSRDAKDPQMEHFGLHIDAHDVALPRDGSLNQGQGLYQGELRVAIVGYLADGRSEAYSTTPLRLRFSHDGLDKVLKEGIEADKNMKLGANVKKLRFIVVDVDSSALGSLTIPINTEVPGAAK